jgi:myosin heavy subunit
MQELKKSDDARQTKLYQRFGNVPVPEDLVDFYQHLDPADLVDFVQVESEYVNVIQGTRLQLGRVYRAAQQLFAHAGSRSDLHETMTFERWVRAHGQSKQTALRLITLADQVDLIQAQALDTHDDGQLMIENYLTLSQSDQMAIADGKVDEKVVGMLLHATPDMRKSPIWKGMLKELHESRQAIEAQKKQLQTQTDQIQQLTQRNSDLERSRSDFTDQLSAEKEENRHLQLQLAEAQAQEPEPVEVPPADYDELKERRVELEAQLKDTEQTLEEIKKELHEAQSTSTGTYSQEDIDDLQEQLAELTQQNQELTKQVKAQAAHEDSRQKAFQTVSARSTDMLSALPRTLDVMALAGNIEQLTDKELQQTDLPALANALEDKASQLRKLMHESQRVVEGDFSEIKGKGDDGA